MKKRIGMLCATLLFSCQGPESSVPSMTYTYDEIETRIIPWENLFDVEESHYYTLVFSKSCQHCLAIEERVIRYALSDSQPPLFFIEATPDIPKGTSISATLGATSVEAVYVLGWPTLLEIEEATLVSHVAGEKAISEKLA
mgnify:CR=1 FL=1